MEFRTANPASFKVLERELLQIDHRENEFVWKFSITLEPSILNASSSKILRPRSWCELLSLYLSFFPFSLAFPLTRFETSWEDKLINYESYFPIQWIDRALDPATCLETVPSPPPPLASTPLFPSLLSIAAREKELQCYRSTGKLRVFLNILSTSCSIKNELRRFLIQHAYSKFNSLVNRGWDNLIHRNLSIR